MTPWTPILCPWDSPGTNNGVDCHFLLQRIFLTQGLNWVSCITGKFFIVCPPGKPKRFLRPLSSLLFFEAQEDRAVFCVNTLCVLCLVAQSCLTLCDPMGCSPPGFSVHGGFSRQEYWNGLPCPPLGDLPDPGIKPTSLMSPEGSTCRETCLTSRFFTTRATWEAQCADIEF